MKSYPTAPGSVFNSTLSPCLLRQQICCLLQGPPAAKWERETADTHTASRTWGLRDDVLRQLAEEPSPAMLEINSRLASMYPAYDIALMPAEHMQHAGMDGQRSGQLSHQHASADINCSAAADNAEAATAADNLRSGPASGDNKAQSNITHGAGAAEKGRHSEQAQQDTAGPADHQAAFCAAFVGNAPVHGDTYCYHVDADPSGLPPSRFATALTTCTDLAASH